MSVDHRRHQNGRSAKSAAFSRANPTSSSIMTVSRHCFARMMNAIISLAAKTFELVHCSLHSLHNGTIMKISAKRVKYLLSIVAHSADISPIILQSGINSASRSSTRAIIASIDVGHVAGETCTGQDGIRRQPNSITTALQLNSNVVHEGSLTCFRSSTDWNSSSSPDHRSR